MLCRVKHSVVANREVALEADRLCSVEVADKKATHMSLDEACGYYVITPRFPVDQGVKRKCGKLKRRVRLIDDFSASGVNNCVSPGEKIDHDYLDVLVGTMQMLASGGRRLKLRKDDFVGAYKTLPLMEKELDLAVAVSKNSDGKVQALQLLCCPFGAVGSVHGWHRLGAAMQIILSRLFGIAYPRYVDDLFGADLDDAPEECPVATAVGTSHLARWVIESLLGWE